MKTNTQHLTGPALDWAVAKCENPEWSNEDAIVNVTTFDDYDGTICNYSTDWSQGGPIIEREIIDTFRNYEERCWQAEANRYSGCPMGRGDTPLIAAMRCYVASKLGAIVDIPDELIT